MASEQVQSKKARREWLGPVIALAFIVALVFAVRWRQSGNPENKVEQIVLRDLVTLVGSKAPPFSLSDADGKTYQIDPGDGRNHVLIFHMGSI